RRCFSGDVVTGGVDVCRVEANAKPLGFAHVLNDVSELFEAMTETRALAGRGLERDLRFQFPFFSKHGIDRQDSLFETGFFAGAEMRAGMKNQKRQLELIGADEFLRKGADRVRQKLRIRCREVNQIIRVGKDRQQLATLAMFEKRADLLTRKWTREPL